MRIKEYAPFLMDPWRCLSSVPQAYFASNIANRWLGVRVEFIGTEFAARVRTSHTESS